MLGMLVIEMRTGGCGDRFAEEKKWDIIERK